MLPNPGVYIKTTWKMPSLIDQLRAACNDELMVTLNEHDIVIDFGGYKTSYEKRFQYLKKLTDVYTYHCDDPQITLSYHVDDDMAMYFLSVGVDENIAEALKKLAKQDSEFFPKTLKYLEMVSIIEK